MNDTETIHKKRSLATPVGVLRWIANVIADPDLTDAEARVAVAIATRIGNKTGAAWPSKTTIALDSTLSKRTVDNAVNKLQSKQYIAVERAKGRASNRYRLSSDGKSTMQPAAGLDASTMQPAAGLTVQPAAPELANENLQNSSRAKRASVDPASRKKRTGADTLPDDLPAELLDVAQNERRDMSPSLLYRTWRKFVSHHRGYGTRSPDWTALWTAYVLSERLTPEQQAEAKSPLRFSSAL